MATPTESLAVTLTELTALATALPTLLGPDHPHLAAVDGALRDVGAGLFGLLRTTFADTDGPAGLPSATHAHASTTAQQLQALRALQTLLRETQPEPAHPGVLDEGLEMLCALLEIAGPATP